MLKSTYEDESDIPVELEEYYDKGEDGQWHLILDEAAFMEHPLAAKIVSITMENEVGGDDDDDDKVESWRLEASREALAAAEKGRAEAEEKVRAGGAALAKSRAEVTAKGEEIEKLTAVPDVPMISPADAGDNLEAIADGRVVLSE